MQHKHYLFIMISAMLSHQTFSFITTFNFASPKIDFSRSADFVPSQRPYFGIEKYLPASIRPNKQSSKLAMLFGNNKKQKVERIKTVCEAKEPVRAYTSHDSCNTVVVVVYDL
jgi:hypothetical protein